MCHPFEPVGCYRYTTDPMRHGGIEPPVAGLRACCSTLELVTLSILLGRFRFPFCQPFFDLPVNRFDLSGERPNDSNNVLD